MPIATRIYGMSYTYGVTPHTQRLGGRSGAEANHIP